MDGLKNHGLIAGRGIGVLVAVVLLGVMGVAFGQEEGAADGQNGAVPSIDDVRNRVLERRAASPLIEPRSRTEGAVRPLTGPAVGVAPGLGPTPLKREGSFVVSRRGRVVESGGRGMGWMFVFDSDNGGGSDTPMLLMPCRLLEDLEEVATTRGDTAAMLVSGEVYVYRGENYLLPTVMRLAADRANLSP